MSDLDARAIKDAFATDAEALDVAARRVVERAEREGLVDVAYATLDTPLGVAAVAATERGLVRVMLPNESLDETVERIASISPRVLELPARLDDERRQLDEYFAGRRREFDLPLDWRLTPTGFYRRVLRAAARKLPYGSTASYGDVAGWAGSPRAYRAAGSALGSNPIPIVVPCHRVLRAGGALGQYGGGPEMKAFLLRLEGAISE